MRRPTILALALLSPFATATQQTDVDGGLALVRQALDQQQELELWTDVVPTTEQAKAMLARAGVRGEGDAARALAGYVTADAVGAWHQVLMDANLGGTDVNTAAEQSRGPGIDGIVASLTAVEGTLPITSRVLANILFETQDYDRATTVLAAALERFPESADVHDVARQWYGFHPSPRSVISTLDGALERIATERAIDAEVASRMITTQGHFFHADGLLTYNQNDLANAAANFEKAARHFSTADAIHHGLDTFEVARMTAESWNYAGWSHYYLAVNTLGEDAAALDDATRTAGGSRERVLDTETKDAVLVHMQNSERAFLSALRARHGDEGAVLGLTFVGSFYKDNLGDDLCRDFFARIAPRATEASWWNNLGFLARDTGVAAEGRGEDERAHELYEQAHAAYARCIELAPDNSRWVNDTGLMLYYHLNRDLDVAETHFKNAWQLGRDVCDNPFVDQDTFDENFMAYTDAMLNLARLYNDQGKLDEAKKVADELVELAPERPDAQMTKRVIDAKIDAGATSES